MGKLVFDGAGAETAVGFDAVEELAVVAGAEIAVGFDAVVEHETDGVGAVAVVV